MTGTRSCRSIWVFLLQYASISFSFWFVFSCKFFRMMNSPLVCKNPQTCSLTAFFRYLVSRTALATNFVWLVTLDKAWLLLILIQHRVSRFGSEVYNIFYRKASGRAFFYMRGFFYLNIGEQVALVFAEPIFINSFLCGWQLKVTV